MNLFPHQIRCLKQTEDQNRVAYYLDMGLGKTFIGSEKMMSFRTLTNLVVCQKSKIQDWVDHFKSQYGKDALDLTIPKNLSQFMAVDAGQKYLQIGVINYELLWRRSDLLMLHNFTLTLDESSLIQNPKAKQSKFVLCLDPVNVILLSGTPTGGKYENLWTQMHLLGWKISEDVYQSQYVNYKLIEVGLKFHKIVDMNDPYRNVDRLKQKMRDHGAVFLKTEEVMDLPEQNFQIIKIPTTKEYKKFDKMHLVTVGDREFVGDSIFSFRMGKRQLCGAYNPEKVQAFKDLVESTQDRLVVFYNFNSELDAIHEVCEELGRPHSFVNGEFKDLTAYETESNSVTLVQFQAGSMGLNLQKANKIIYFSLTEESTLFEQSKKRIHRIGQERSCFYYLLVCQNSIEDQEILPTLNIRKEYTDNLFEEKDG